MPVPVSEAESGLDLGLGSMTKELYVFSFLFSFFSLSDSWWGVNGDED